MAGVRFLQRYWKQMSYSANEIASIQLPTLYEIHAIILRLSGTLTIGTASATARKNREPLGLIKKVRLIANGKDVICSLSGSQLYELNMIKKGTAGEITPCSALTAAAYSIAGTIVIDLADPRNKVEMDTILRTKGLASLDLEVTWGTGSDVVTPDTTTTLVFSSTVIDVSLIESFGTPDNAPLILNKQYSLNRSITASSADFQIDNLPVGNFYRSMTLITYEALARSSGILNQIVLKAGEEIFANLKASTVIPMMKGDKQIETSVTGVYHLDFAKYGSIGDLLDLRQTRDLKLSLDVTAGAASTIDVLIQEYILPTVTK